MPPRRWDSRRAMAISSASRPNLAGADGLFAGLDGEGDAFDGIHHGAARVPGIGELALAVVW